MPGAGCRVPGPHSARDAGSEQGKFIIANEADARFHGGNGRDADGDVTEEAEDEAVDSEPESITA